MTVQPIPDHLARVLLYIAALNEGGAEPQWTSVNTFATAAVPKDRETLAWSAMRGELYQTLGSYSRPAEDVAHYIREVGWVRQVDSGGLALTKLGRALVRSLKDQTFEAPEEDGVTILNPSDPLRYETLTRTMVAAGRGMLVDPYFKAKHVSWLTSYTAVERVLIGGRTRDQKSELGPLAFRLGNELARREMAFEVRSTSDRSLHDRALLSDSGKVSLLGTSLTGIGTHLSAVVPLPLEAGEPLKKHLERLWDEAEVVQPRTTIEEAPEGVPKEG